MKEQKCYICHKVVRHYSIIECCGGPTLYICRVCTASPSKPKIIQEDNIWTGFNK